MIRPATIDDLFSLVVKVNEVSSWHAILASDDVGYLIKKNKMVVGCKDDKPYFCLGVGSVKLAASVIPWVWAAVDVSAKPNIKHFLKEDLPLVRRYLDDNAKFAYTAPEGEDPVYTRFLEYMGFIHLGWGLWQWVSSKQQ